MANILYIGLDPDAIKDRVVALREAGHSLSEASDVRQVIAACSGIAFDVVVLGQGLPGMEKRRVAEIVRKCNPQTKILELYDAAERELALADDHLHLKGKSSEALLEALNRLASMRKSA